MAVILVLHCTERFGVVPYGTHKLVILVFQGLLYISQFVRVLDHMRGLRTFAIFVHLILMSLQDFCTPFATRPGARAMQPVRCLCSELPPSDLRMN